MADSKITALTAISTVDPTADPLVIVDVSDTSMAASGTTKKSTINQLLGAGGTATLASATITGDLTVDTNTLKVDSANDRVGVGTVSPTAKLHVSSTGSVHINQRTGGNGCFTQYVDPVSSNYVGTDSGNFRVANNSAQDLLNIQQLGVFTFGDGAGGTRMTLNATGLGVGVSPSYKLDVRGSDNSVIAQFGGTNRQVRLSTSAVSAVDNTSFNFIHTSGSGRFTFQNNSGTQTMLTIDDNGNNILRMPVTPPTLGVNFEGTFNLTSNTNLRISVRGSDGVTRVANITLA